MGTFAGLLLYGWMFWMGAMGGGDVKLLMALGALGGVRYALEVALLGVILGGVLAVVLMLLKKRFFTFLKQLSRFILTVVTKELEPEVPRVDRSFTMPYGVPIAAASLWVLFDNPWLRMGVQLWN